MRSVGINSIISPVADSELLERPVRVLGFRDKWVIVIELMKAPRKPLLLDMAFLFSEVEAGTVQVDVELPLKFMIRHEDEISQREKDSRDRNWELIRELVEGKLAVEVLVDGFGSNVKLHAEAKGVDRKIIYRLLYRYWSLGQVKNAFLWDTTRCGGPGKSKSRDSGVVPGRPPKYRGSIVDDRAVILDDRHLSAIRVAFSLFASGKCGSIVECYNWMLSKFYTETFADGSKGDVIRGSHPTLGQLQYNGRKFFDKLYILKNRRGQIRWNKDFRPLVGEASQGLVGPCHRYEVDSTVADVYLVHRINRNWLIGRPVLYVVVDSYSRMIVGIHVGLEGPSWNGARHALYNAYTPKKEFCSRYGIDIDDSEWPCFHLPLELTADRAELLSEAGETMSNTLGTVLNIPPPYRPDWKGIVESRFRLINEKLDIKFIPGGVDARRLERGDRDYELDAVLDLDEFTRMVIAGVLVHNSSLRLPHLQTPEMIAEDLDPTPLRIWNWAMSHNFVNTRVVSPAELKVALLPSQECRITRGGIQFQGVLYTCELAKRESWLAESHNFRSKYIRVWYDPNSIDNCWVKDGADFQPLTIIPQQAQKYSGYRMEEVADFLSATRQISPESKYQALNQSAKLKALQEDTLAVAKEKKALAGKLRTKAEFKRDKKVKRSTEVQVERDYQTAELNQLRDAPADVSPSVVPVPVERSGSRRSAAFLKLVKSDFLESDK